MNGRTSLENELSVLPSRITESLEGPIRKTKINALFESCKSILEKALAKNDELVILANKTDKPSKLLTELAAWWDRIVKVIDGVTGKARAHMESNQASEVCVSETSWSKVSSKSAKFGSSKQSSMKSLNPNERRKELLLAKMKREELEKQNEATLRLKQQEAIIEEQQHLIEMERKQQEFKFEIDRKEQEHRLRIEKSRLDMERLSEENHIKLAEAKMVETEYLEESEIDQHLELASSVDRRSDKVNDWVDHALENQKGPKVVPFSKFENFLNIESGSHQHRNVSTAEASPRRSVPNQTFDCDQQCYPYQPTVSFSNGDGIKHAVSTSPEHETQSLLISNNATLCENNTSSFFSPAGTAATNTPICCYFSIPHPPSSIQHIPVNNFNNDSRVVGKMPANSNQYSGDTPHAIVSQPPANLICSNQNLLSHNVYSNPASVNKPLSGQSAVISQPNLRLMSKWRPAVTQCIIGLTSDGSTNPSVGVFSSVTPISQHQFPHVSSGGTVYYGFPNHDAWAENTYINQQQPFAADPSKTLPSLQPAPQSQAVTLNGLVQALSVSKKDPLPEWKLAQYDGNPLQLHEWFGQFCSTVDAASLSDDVKLTYLKTLVTGKAKSAIAEFAYSGRMYKDALKTLERKFGQPQKKRNYGPL